MKILIAEDNTAARRHLENMLTEAGYEVTSVSDGVEAWLEMQKEDAPQLVILDWTMPRMDGIKVCRGIRDRGSVPYVYIVILTSHTDSADLFEGFEAGADDYVVKPYDSKRLMARLKVGERILALEQKVAKLREEKATLQMAATLGHEINNPLAVIMPNIEFLRMDLLNLPGAESCMKRLETIEGAARRIHAIANKLRDLRNVRTKEYHNGVRMLDLD